MDNRGPRPGPASRTPSSTAPRRPPIRAAEPAYLADLARLVNIDCGSYTPAGVDEVGRFVAGFLDRHRRRGRGGRIPTGRLRGRRSSAHWTAARPAGRVVLLIGHMDTVFDPGTAAERPFAIDPDGRRLRPRRDRHEVRAPRRPLRRCALVAGGGSRCRSSGSTFVANPDEEIGSLTSTPHIRELAADSRRLPRPRVRPGERRHRLVAEGHPRRPDHRPRPGRPRRRRAREGPLRDPRRGRPVHPHPRAERPLAGRHVQRRRRRGRHPSERRRRALRARGRRPGRPARRTSRRPRRRSGVAARPLPCPTRPPRSTEMARWWPMEKLERSGRLVDHASALARRLGFEVKDTATGGASDANTTAGMGIPSNRRARPDRRDRPLAGGVPRGRLDRAADGARGGAAARDRPRSVVHGWRAARPRG